MPETNNLPFYEFEGGNYSMDNSFKLIHLLLIKEIEELKRSIEQYSMYEFRVKNTTKWTLDSTVKILTHLEKIRNNKLINNENKLTNLIESLQSLYDENNNILDELSIIAETHHFNMVGKTIDARYNYKLAKQKSKQLSYVCITQKYWLNLMKSLL